MSMAWDTARASKGLCEAKGLAYSTVIVPFPEKADETADDSVQDVAENYLFPVRNGVEHMTRVELLIRIGKLLKVSESTTTTTTTAATTTASTTSPEITAAVALSARTTPATPNPSAYTIS